MHLIQKKAKAEGKKITIISSDKDLMQLLGKNVSMIDPLKKKEITSENVIEKFGVGPEKVIEVQALAGDTSDNIPGVQKVGPKTAVNWLTKYETVENIIANAEEISGKVGEYLREGIEQLKLSQKLTTIKKDVELDFGINDLKVGKRDTDQLHKLFTDLEFKTLIKSATAKEKTKTTKKEYVAPSTEEHVPPKAVDSKYQCILTEKDLDALIKKLSKAKILALDTETDGLDFTVANLVGISVSAKAGEAAYIPIQHDYEGAPKQLSKKTGD